MPMSPRLLRPIASGVHPEAKVWQNAVIANSGTVSAGTVKAVSDFCKSIDAAGIRSKIWRLSLFCGGDLNSALVPLYRGPSRTGTQYGNTTDTNNGPFVSGDYTEAGASGGLKGNASTKYLDTGFAQSTIALSDCHLSISGIDLAQGHQFIGVFGGAQSDFAVLRRNPSDGILEASICNFSVFANASNGLSSESHALGVRSTTSSLTLYRNGVSVGTNTSTVTTATTSRSYFVFGLNNSGSVQFPASARFRMYSIGQAIDAAGASAFSNAVAAFNTALGRT